MQVAPRVLVITARDVGGSLCFLAQELRRRGQADVRVLALDRHRQAQDAEDLVELHDGGRELEGLVEHAEILHLVDLQPDALELLGRPLVGLPGKRIVVQIDGRDPELDLVTLSARARDCGWPMLATRPAVAAELGARFLPPFIPWWRGPWTPLIEGTRRREVIRRPGIVFVSSRVPIDRRPRLEDLLDDAEDLAATRNNASANDAPQIYMETVVGRAHRQVLQRRRFAHLTLTAADDGLSLSALESLSQGVPVIADLDLEQATSYGALVGGLLPPVYAEAELKDRIDAIVPRDPVSSELASWARECLDPRRWFDTCRALWTPRRRVSKRAA